MKQLQKDTTTPEQSQRLLELGVPKWTANYKHGYVGCCSGENVLDMDNVISCNELFDGEIPLWSSGRLMEIYDICTGTNFQRRNRGDTLLDDVIWQIDAIINKKLICTEIMDFSKLEE